MARDIRLANATIGFHADTTQFTGALAKSEAAVRRKQRAVRNLRRQLRRTQGVLQQSTRSFLSLGAVLGGAAAGGGFLAFTKRSAEAGAELREMGIRLGFTVERLQTLQRVFEGDGVAAEKFYKSMQFLNKALFEAREGLSTPLRSLDALGLDINELESAEDAIEAIADAVREGVGRGEGVSTLTGALQGLLGRDGATLFNALRQGSEGIIEQEEHFGRLGVLTTELAEDLKGLEQSNTDLSNALATQRNILTAGLVEPLERLNLDTIERLPGIFDALGTGLDYTLENLRSAGQALAVFGLLLFRGRAVAAFSVGLHNAAVSALNLGRVIPAVALRVGTLGRAVLAVGQVSRTSFSVAAISLGIFRASVRVTQAALIGLRTVVLTVTRSLSVLLIPFAVIEGLLSLIDLLRSLARNADALGVSFGDAGKVLIVDFLAEIASGLSRLPGIFGGSILAAVRTARVVIAEASAAVGNLLIDFLLGRTQDESIEKQFSAIITRGLVAGREVFDTVARPLFSPESIAEPLLRGFGFDEDTQDRARSARAAAIDTTLENLTGRLNALTGDFGQIEAAPIEIDVNDDQLRFAAALAADIAESGESLGEGMQGAVDEQLAAAEGVLGAWEASALEAERSTDAVLGLVETTGDAFETLARQVDDAFGGQSLVPAEQVSGLVDAARAAAQSGLGSVEAEAEALVATVGDQFDETAVIATDAAREIETAFVTAFERIEGAVVAFSRTGRREMDDLVDSISVSLARLEVSSQQVSFIPAAFEVALGGAGGAFRDVLGGVERDARSVTEGIERGLANLADYTTDAARQIEETLGSAFRGVEDSLVQFVTTGRVEFGSLVNSIVADLARLVVRQQIIGPIAQALSAAFGGVGSGAGAPPPTTQFFHSGGLVRGSGNVPAVLQAGEEVLTRFDPRHQANLRAPEVMFTLRNEGTPQQARQDGPIRFDGARWVISLVTSDIQEGGGVAQAIERSFGARQAVS